MLASDLPRAWICTGSPPRGLSPDRVRVSPHKPAPRSIHLTNPSPGSPPFFCMIGKHIIVLKGSLAPESAVVKLSGKELPQFTGPAIVFDSEDDAFEGIMTGQVGDSSRKAWH